ncbi:fish-egg lectin-like [Engraulis encrasicolus]|uniref:fish-egg lectin-like n=1 Tax=Engraulis encrasicolus TaxID=184585 RepID=UPI002FD3849C
MVCKVVPGRLRQIDAGAGQVVGISDSKNIYTLHNGAWKHIPGVLKHISVGSAGTWGIGLKDEIYKMVAGSCVRVPGGLKQVDAGGEHIISGVNSADGIYCMSRDGVLGFKGPGSPTPWLHIPGGLKYYSCGPIGCWGVNRHNNIYMMKGVSPASCGGTMSWTHVPGSLAMVEVASDGTVYGVSPAGHIYRREGVTSCNPTGVLWTPVGDGSRYKHVSYDLGHLWALRADGTILDCV